MIQTVLMCAVGGVVCLWERPDAARTTKADIKIDESYVKESAGDGGTSQVSDEDDEP